MYRKGEGVKQDYAKSLEWYLKSAKQGSKESQNSLGNMYFEGLGVDKDYIQAYVWFQLAETNGL